MVPSTWCAAHGHLLFQLSSARYRRGLRGTSAQRRTGRLGPRHVLLHNGRRVPLFCHRLRAQWQTWYFRVTEKSSVLCGVYIRVYT